MIVLALTVVSFPSFNRPLKLYLVRALTASQKESFANEKSQEMLIEKEKVESIDIFTYFCQLSL